MRHFSISSSIELNFFVAFCAAAEGFGDFGGSTGAADCCELSDESEDIFGTFSNSLKSEEILLKIGGNECQFQPVSVTFCSAEQMENGWVPHHKVKLALIGHDGEQCQL